MAKRIPAMTITLQNVSRINSKVVRGQTEELTCSNAQHKREKASTEATDQRYDYDEGTSL
jgi:hypothetical protein